MQAGFTCYEVGSISSKNIISVAVENLITLMIVIIGYLIIGYFLMFGKVSESDMGFVFLQIMLAAVCVTIFGGAMSERSRLTSLLIASFFSAVFIYPVMGSFIWNEHGFLNRLGYIDFAGASVVHLTGGIIALAGIIVVGKRAGGNEYKSNVPFSVLGVFLLWFGWFGFNAGSASSLDDTVALVIMNTTLGAAFGMAGALFYHLIFKRKNNYLTAVFNGVLGGLTGITACSAYVSYVYAAIISFIAGFVVVAVHYLLIKLNIDDAVDAVSVHAGGGIAGLLLLPFFVESEYLNASDRMMQFLIQLLGAAVNIAFVFALAFAMFKIIDKTLGLRVSPEMEEKGLNISEFEDIYSYEQFMEKAGYEKELTEKNRLLRKQSRLLEVTEEQEKDRIRKDLHDGVGQTLAALKVNLGIAKTKDDDEQLVDNAINLADSAISEMRAVLNTLNPPKLDEGLAKAIEQMAEQINKMEGPVVKVESSDNLKSFNDTVALNIYRVIQEAVSNAIKHSGCSEIKIDLTDDENRLHISIADDGTGFNIEDSHTGMGLSTMSDRVKMLGGEIDISSTEGEGTVITIEVPDDGE